MEREDALRSAKLAPESSLSTGLAALDWRTDHHDVMGRTNVRFGQEQALRTPSLAGLYESIRSTG